MSKTSIRFCVVIYGDPRFLSSLTRSLSKCPSTLTLVFLCQYQLVAGVTLNQFPEILNMISRGRLDAD